WRTWTPTDRLATWLVVYGALLPVIPEFVFLRDAFDNRMNTMFKVDYQSWILLMLAGAYGVVSLVLTLRASSRQQAAVEEFERRDVTEDNPTAAHGLPYVPRSTALAASVISVALIVFAMTAAAYPVIVTYQKTGHLNGSVGTDFPGAGVGWQGLDGLRYLPQTHPDWCQMGMSRRGTQRSADSQQGACVIAAKQS